LFPTKKAFLAQNLTNKEHFWGVKEFFDSKIPNLFEKVLQKNSGLQPEIFAKKGDLEKGEWTRVSLRATMTKNTLSLFSFLGVRFFGAAVFPQLVLSLNKEMPRYVKFPKFDQTFPGNLLHKKPPVFTQKKLAEKKLEKHTWQL